MVFSNIVILVSKLFYKLSKHYYSLEGVTLEFEDKINDDPHWKLYFLTTICHVVRAMVNGMLEIFSPCHLKEGRLTIKLMCIKECVVSFGHAFWGALCI